MAIGRKFLLLLDQTLIFVLGWISTLLLVCSLSLKAPATNQFYLSYIFLSNFLQFSQLIQLCHRIFYDMVKKLYDRNPILQKKSLKRDCNKIFLLLHSYFTLTIYYKDKVYRISNSLNHYFGWNKKLIVQCQKPHVTQMGNLHLCLAKVEIELET